MTLETLNDRFNFGIKLGIELEFYSNEKIECFKELISQHFCLIERITEEKGDGQYEISTLPTNNISLLLSEVNNFKVLVREIADFSAKPCMDQPGSALHVHVSLHDKEFQKNITRLEPKLRSFIVGGFCNLMRSSMLCFAPSIESYKRFQYYDKFTPRFINWGFEENKTNAVRVTHNTIEHRIAGADAMPSKVLGQIMRAIEYGICNEVVPRAPNFGESQYADAFHDRLPLSYSEAIIHSDEHACFADVMCVNSVGIQNHSGKVGVEKCLCCH
ncbi:glutamine synthetase [Neorickettsia sp. 179522]|uniref:glutamine synthetase n=1 Tax=Neorickettsia sp. 179522 TaxID=1714371 RepID=UPI000603F764|nr:glutamine synthetase [Neorickettsia sp. 179522]KYH12931.1 glutamine synthetase [Neorickettsia sp. 179522]